MPAKSACVHPSIAYVQSVIAKFKTKTGRTIDEWVEFVNKDGPKSESDRRTWLKERHQLGTNYAWWIAERSVGKGVYREHVFAEIKPATNGRIDLGLALGKLKGRVPKRIQPVKNAKGNRITHRISIESVEQVDKFVEKWLRKPYEADETD